VILTFLCQECGSSYRGVRRRRSQSEVQCSCTFQASVLTGIQIFPFYPVFRIPLPRVLGKPMECYATGHGTVPFQNLLSYMRGLNFASQSPSSEVLSFVSPSRSCGVNLLKASTICFRISFNQLLCFLVL
jgi:hypothetical protein